MHAHLHVCINVCLMKKQTYNGCTYNADKHIDIHYMQVDIHKDGLTDRQAHIQT